MKEAPPRHRRSIRSRCVRIPSRRDDLMARFLSSFFCRFLTAYARQYRFLGNARLLEIRGIFNPVRKQGVSMNLKLLAICGVLLAILSAGPNEAQAPKPDAKALAATGILDRLAERSGVYGIRSAAKVPGLIAD